MPQAVKTLRPSWLGTPRDLTRNRDARRRRRLPWRKWYSLKIWHQIREAQLTAEPLCAYCKARGKLVKATVCDHITPHRGDWQAFCAGPFQSLCDPCHNSVKQAEERASQ